MPGWHPVLPRLSAVAVSGCSKQTSTLPPPQAAVCCNSSSHIKLIFIPLLWWGGGCINVDGHYKGFIFKVWNNLKHCSYSVMQTSREHVYLTDGCKPEEPISDLKHWSGWTVPFSCDRFPWRRSVLHKLEILQHLTWSDQCALNDSWMFVYMWCVRSPA